MHPHSSCIHAHMQTYKADFYNALYVPPGSKMLLTFAEILVTLRGCSVWSLTIVSVFCCFSMPCCPVGKPATRLSRASKQMKVIIIWAAFHTCCITEYSFKRFARGLMWIQRLALHPITCQKFSVWLLWSRMPSKEWLKLEKVQHKKKQVSIIQNYIWCLQLTMTWFKSLKIFVRLTPRAMNSNWGERRHLQWCFARVSHLYRLFGNNSIKGWNWTQTAGQLCRHNK